jgi:hypothetical protein
LLNEAAFTAGQKADQVFESRLGQARGLIEQSAKLVEDAGAETAQRLEAQVAAARSALEGLNTMMDQVAERAARLPAETGAKAQEIKDAVEHGLDQLLASARRAAEETQAIDAAFQERVRRNYEMLSEAVQLMGVVAQGGQGAGALHRSTPAERARDRVAAALTSREAPAAKAPEPPAPLEAAPEPPPPPSPGSTLRGRLRLTPTATDAEFKDAPVATTAPPAEEGGWSWKELLTTLDDEPAPDAAGQPAPAPQPRMVSEPLRGGQMPADARLGDELFREIEAMGIDPGALLPRGRIDEIAAAIQTGDGPGAREVVRTLAPAAIRRIARRMLSDAGFRARVQALTTRYTEVIAEATARDRQGFQAAALLATNSGRAYLLLDAAAGQPG